VQQQLTRDKKQRFALFRSNSYQESSEHSPKVADVVYSPYAGSQPQTSAASTERPGVCMQLAKIYCTCKPAVCYNSCRD
jgi:hypothetical protein